MFSHHKSGARNESMKAKLTAILFLLAFNILLPVIFYIPVITPTVAAQVNSTGNNLVKTVQEASQNGTDYLRARILIKGIELSAEIPTRGELMGKGLAVKDQLKENEAMFFVFDKPEKHSFWMKDMNFPIDIIWLDSNGRVVHIEQNLRPCPLVPVCPSYAPTIDSQYVLETVAGFAQRHKIGLGADIKVDLMG